MRELLEKGSTTAFLLAVCPPRFAYGISKTPFDEHLLQKQWKIRQFDHPRIAEGFGKASEERGCLDHVVLPTTSTLCMQMPNAHYQWIVAPKVLEEGCVYVWQANISDCEDLLIACASVLTIEEQERAGRLRSGRVRNQFVAARGLLRMLLSELLGRSPMDVGIEVGPYGKLYVPAKEESSVSFNVAHSGDTVLIALRSDGEVGVDLEVVDSSVNVLEVARTAFHPNETARVAACLDLEERQKVFFRYWTRKEAVAKADGRGLSLSFDSFEVPFEGTHDVPVVVLDVATETSKVYFLHDLPLGDNLSSTVALDSRGCDVQLIVLPTNLKGSVRDYLRS